MYTLRFAASFKKSYKTLVGKQQDKEKKIEKSFNFLMQDPFYPSLKSHKANTRSFGQRWSSWVTGDLRIIWDFDPDQEKRIIIFAVATHSGKHREYS